jgi:hypothetical protein
MSFDPDAIGLAKRFEPILLFHSDERFFPIDPKFYLERCALWRSKPIVRSFFPGGSLQEKQDLGEPPPTVFPRRPQLAKGEIAALKDEAGGGKTWIGEPSNLVIPEQDTERPLHEDRFLQLTGWEPFVAAPNEVTATSENRHATLDANVYDGALQGGQPWYYCEYLNHQDLVTQFSKKTPNGLDLFRVIFNERLSQPRLVIYHFFYALHEEPLRGCEEAGEGQTFATFAGEWTSVAILINSANEPLFVGLTSRNVGDPTSIPTEENRLGMIVHPWKEVERVGDHPKIFVSRGTHGNYLTTGPHDLKAFTPGDIDVNQGTCAEIEELDNVIPGGDIPAVEPEDADATIWILKSIFAAPFGALLALIEDAGTKFGSSGIFITPDQKPQDETGGPLFGLILRPAGLFVPEQATAQRTEDWQTKMPGPTDKPRFDFIVDRETQLWWPPRDANRGYAGRWGPRVTNDPKARRSGMRCPSFALLFLEGIARL